jgi:hypothetical protein
MILKKKGGHSGLRSRALCDLAILEALKNGGRLRPTDEPLLAALRELVQKAKGSSA